MSNWMLAPPLFGRLFFSYLRLMARQVHATCYRWLCRRVAPCGSKAFAAVDFADAVLEFLAHSCSYSEGVEKQLRRWRGVKLPSRATALKARRSLKSGRFIAE